MKRFGDPFLLALLAVSLFGNVLLYRRAIVNPASPELKTLQAGDHVPSLTGVQVGTDRPVTIDFSQRPAVVYVFRSSCGWCERNLDNAALLASSVGPRYDFIAVALEDDVAPEKYLRGHNLDWRTVTGIPAATREAYRIVGTPQTFVIGLGGRIEHVWAGAFQSAIASDVESVFGLKLPGLRRGPG